MKYFPLLVVAFISFLPSAFAQQNTAYQLSYIPADAYSASLGGKTPASIDNVNLLFQNPALVSTVEKPQAGLNYINYISDINFGTFSVGLPLKGDVYSTGLGVKYLDYGKFQRADENGNIDGEFKATQYQINLSGAMKYDSLFTFGLGVNAMGGNYDNVNFFGLGFDLGALFQSRNKQFNAGLVFKNIGKEYKSLQATKSALPFKIELGMNYKVKHAPFRVNFAFQELQKYDLRNAYSVQLSKSMTVLDNSLRHLLLGVEFLMLKQFHIRAGYNYRQMQDMKVNGKSGIAGLSLGFGLNLSKFTLAYSFSKYHFAGNSNQFSFLMNLPKFTR